MYEENLELDRRTGSIDGAIVSLTNISSASLGLGDVSRAVETAEEALAEAIRFGSARMAFQGRMWLLNALKAAGELDRLESEIEVMRESEKLPGSDFLPGATDFWASIAKVERGDPDGAVSDMIEGLRRFGGMPDPYDFTGPLSWTVEQGARLVALLGRADLAARLLGSSEAMCERKGYVRDGHRMAEVGAISESIRKSLGNEGFEEQFRIGAQMTEQDAHQALRTALEEALQD